VYFKNCKNLSGQVFAYLNNLPRLTLISMTNCVMLLENTQLLVKLTSLQSLTLNNSLQHNTNSSGRYSELLFSFSIIPPSSFLLLLLLLLHHFSFFIPPSSPSFLFHHFSFFIPPSSFLFSTF
jgi:hypothetical protein